MKAGDAPQLAPTYADVAYGAYGANGANEQQVLDMWQATANQPTPVVFHIHGGGWVRGDKRPVKDMERVARLPR